MVHRVAIRTFAPSRSTLARAILREPGQVMGRAGGARPVPGGYPLGEEAAS